MKFAIIDGGVAGMGRALELRRLQPPADAQVCLGLDDAMTAPVEAACAVRSA